MASVSNTKEVEEAVSDGGKEAPLRISMEEHHFLGKVKVEN